MARDLLALMLEVEPDSFNLDVHIELPADVHERFQRAEKLREQAAAAQAEAASEVRAVARQLVERGMPLREVGKALGVSYQRVHQLVSSAA